MQVAQLCNSTVAPLGGDITPCTEARIALIEKNEKKQMVAVFAVQKASISCHMFILIYKSFSSVEKLTIFLMSPIDVLLELE